MDIERLEKAGADVLVSTSKQSYENGVAVRVLHPIKKVYPRELVVIIDDDTGIEDLKAIWNRIRNLRDVLRYQDGTDFLKISNYLKLKYAAMYFEEGYSYGEIAMDANLDCLVQLCASVIALEKGDDKRARKYFDNARIFLDVFGIKEKSAIDWLNEGIDEIQNGRAAWRLDKGAIDKQRVVDAIRQFGSHIRTGKIVVKNYKEQVSRYEIPLSKAKPNPGYALARKLLEKMPKRGGLDKLSKAHDRANSKLENPLHVICLPD